VLLSLACVFVGSLSGCRGDGSLGKLVPVTGKVTIDGQRLTTGQVIFQPDAEQGNTLKHEPRGSIDGQGNYVAATIGKKGVPPGWYKVTVIATEPFDKDRPYVIPKTLIPLRYSDPTTSELTVEVVENPVPDAYDFSLRSNDSPKK
jgi:hypothetical protein